MNHRAVYERLLSPENEPALLDLLKEQRVMSLVRARNASVRRDHSPPYIFMIVDADQGISAHCTGVFVRVGSLVAEQGDTPFYLPTIAVSALAAAPGGCGDAALQHELLHLKDMLAIIERDSGYPQRVHDYGMSNTSDPALLAQTVDLEVFKLFMLEPQAFALDYANGETALDIPLLGRLIRIACDTQEEFVHHRIAEYVAGFERRLCERHPAEKERIHTEFERAVDHYGCALLGPSAYRRTAEINAGLVEKILDPRRWVRVKGASKSMPQDGGTVER